ncbi:MAG TPA: phage holin family protein [Puia sp.]|nr:phage holin family protein [Puia sp.]
MNIVVRIMVSAVVAFGLSYFLRAGIHIDTFWTALLLAIVLAILNAIVKPILIILTFPITIITFGLFLFVINAFIILIASKFVRGFSVDSFWWALLFSLLLSVITSLLFRDEGGRNEKSN